MGLGMGLGFDGFAWFRWLRLDWGCWWARMGWGRMANMGGLEEREGLRRGERGEGMIRYGLLVYTVCWRGLRTLGSG